MSAIQNRLEKNYRKLRPWSERNRFEAYRLYDRDIPEFPYIVDIYKDYVVVYDKSDPVKDQGKNHFEPTILAIKTLLKVDDAHIVIKRRQRHDDESEQYEKLSEKRQEFLVQENQFKFLVNLWDYLDTGLFLDHRPSRFKIFKLSSGKKVLNLFCYTGSVSVAAAVGGGRVTSVDLSKTYLDWSKRNFQSNDLNPDEHEFIQADVLQFLKEVPSRPTYDLIFLDPPTFSNSKRMKDVLDTQKDHAWMIEKCLSLLTDQGVLLFSTNKRKFKLEPGLSQLAKITETTKSTIPQDFHDQQIHTSFEIRKM